VTKKLAAPALGIAICLWHIIPFFILVNLAFKSPQDTSSKWVTPTYIHLDNFAGSWRQAHLDRALLNNLIITTAAVALTIAVGALAAYPLARYPTRWNTFVYYLSISILIVPALTILVPLYKFIVDLGGINSYWAITLIQVTFSLPLAIFMFTGFIKTIPRELDEAALIDGCSRYAIFFRIILPLLKPVTATLVILTGLAVWNDFQFSLFFLQRRNVQTVPVLLSQFISQYQNNIAWVAAGCLIGMIPMTCVYFFLQKYFVSGLAEGAIRG
jgi:raffinose/stachyose/melibiose transport system permease protein